MAGVSTGTVDRVLYDRGRVAATTREKILQIVEDLNYRPNLLAQRLASDRIFHFGILIPMQTGDNAYWRFPLKGIETAEKELAGYRVTTYKFFFSLKNESTFIRASAKLLNTNPDAILLAPVFRKEANRFLHQCDKRNIPYVFIDSRIPGKNNLSYFGQDARQSGLLAAKLMNLELAPESGILIVNFVSQLDNHPHFRNRENGFRQYFVDRSPDHNIDSLAISPEAESRLPELLADRITERTRGIFITSSAHKVAKILQGQGYSNICCVGYDLTPHNLIYLKNDTIRFLICQKPVSQGYEGLMALFNHFVRRGNIIKDHYMPLEIVTKENYMFYVENNS